MEVVDFIIFFIASHFGVMQIFRLTTYHAFFWKALPLLLLYGAIVAWVLFTLKLHSFFLWQVILASLWLFIVARKQSKSTSATLTLAGEDANVVRSLADSAAKTSSYYTYSSFIYMSIFVITYMWLYNTQ